MRGVFTDQINIEALKRPSFIDSFYDEFNEANLNDSQLEMEDIFVKPSIADKWGTPELDRFLTFHFLDEIHPKHSVIDALIQDWKHQLKEPSSSTDFVLKLRQLFLPMMENSTLHSRTLMNIEVSMMIHLADEYNLSLPDLHMYDAMDVFQMNQVGICWPTKDGWLHLPFGQSQLIPMDLQQFLSIELTGREPMMVYPNGVRSPQPLQVVDAENHQIIALIRELFPTFNGLGVQEITTRIRNHMQQYDYIVDVEHEWQTLDAIFGQNGGDCEDLAHLEASLLIRALEDAGFGEVSRSIELMTGLVGQGTTQFGHTVIHLNYNGQTFVIDSTLSDGMIFRDAYESIYGFKGLVAYSALSSAGELQRAMAIDTEKSLSSWNNTTTLKNKFLEAMGMTNNDDTGYFDRFTEYYPAVTKNDGSAFWTNASSGSALAEEAMANSGASPPAYEPIDFASELYVGNTLKKYDRETGLAGLMEKVDNRVSEMSVNLTNQSMNKYVGQTYNGYYIYDYSRVMADYTRILDLIQNVTGYLTAITTYCNAFNWIASQLTYESEPNSEIKARQRLVKSVQGFY